MNHCIWVCDQAVLDLDERDPQASHELTISPNQSIFVQLKNEGNASIVVDIYEGETKSGALAARGGVTKAWSVHNTSGTMQSYLIDAYCTNENCSGNVTVAVV